MVIAPFRSLGGNDASLMATRPEFGRVSMKSVYHIPSHTVLRSALCSWKMTKSVFWKTSGLWAAPSHYPAPRAWLCELTLPYRYNHSLSKCPRVFSAHRWDSDTSGGEAAKTVAKCTDSGAMLTGLNPQIYPLLSMGSWPTYWLHTYGTQKMIIGLSS